MKTLVLMRHGHAGNAPGRTDVDRPLTASGRTEAQAAASWLAARGCTPEMILCSHARRTLQTAEAMGLGDRAVTERDLYLASPETVLERIRLVEDVTTLAVIGHNPGMQQLALLLDGSAPQIIGTSFPTAGVAVFTVQARHWSRLHPDDVRIVDVFRP